MLQRSTLLAVLNGYPLDTTVCQPAMRHFCLDECHIADINYRYFGGRAVRSAVGNCSQRVRITEGPPNFQPLARRTGGHSIRRLGLFCVYALEGNTWHVNWSHTLEGVSRYFDGRYFSVVASHW